VIPPLLFALTVGIAYSNELALLLTAGICIITVLGGGHELDDLIVLMGTISTGLLFHGRIRSRSKLIKIGVLAGGAAALLTLGVGALNDQPLATPLFTVAARNGVWAIATGFLITGLLPFVEKRFGVLTDISLLEIGDVSHPLLQELVRRAPGTYNHSINVASLAEHAAEAIGANGLLVRVGAYFHDIGKMFKPGYFVENQQDQENRHDNLVPAMSTLIIIAHVKDGADLARQHHLPEPIIDFIEQHHGTTLVEYFYQRASQRSEANGEEVAESSYRYPGPKPQTKEAGVLMLADASEGACRVLVEPTPARIRDLVHEIVLKKLHDGQFDECGLNLRELRTIEDSLVKTLTAVYHGRVKYPNQRTA
jgi:putative nucleotidyltransferase with HDIG domain